jgi:hypothetical protein
MTEQMTLPGMSPPSDSSPADEAGEEVPPDDSEDEHGAVATEDPTLRERQKKMAERRSRKRPNLSSLRAPEGPWRPTDRERLILYRVRFPALTPTSDETGKLKVPAPIAEDPEACYAHVQKHINAKTALGNARHGRNAELVYLYCQTTVEAEQASAADCRRPNCGPVAAPVRSRYRANTFRCQVCDVDPGLGNPPEDRHELYQLPMTGVAGGEPYD